MAAPRVLASGQASPRAAHGPHLEFVYALVEATSVSPNGFRSLLEP